MIKAIGYAIAGLQAAQGQATIRANNVANFLSEDYTPQRPVQSATASGPVVTAQSLPGNRVVLPNGEFVSNGVRLEEDLVGLKMAEISYKASAKVLSTAAGMSAVLIDALD